ncbi:adenosine deaminase 2-A isoform X2 [Drosophila grimshawi]|uniref:adenosine deaminase 2-A isoform X2 n=1 Tax=Drosophila grimshawi TaxID=7222 RepID=UPI000C870B06|nr:adenosine deaminase 2-A isoform X2 [Drosophila grimshawi]
MAQGIGICGQTIRCFTGNALSELIGQSNLRKSTPADYRKLREIVCTLERFGTLGNDIQLTSNEIEANHVIMCLKTKEYNKGIQDPSQFVPGHQIMRRLKKMKESPLFLLLSKMPKGGVLKAHAHSMCSTDFLIKLTYAKNLWVCTTDNGCKFRQFRFSKVKPTRIQYEEGEWQLMEQLRDYHGEANLRKYLKNALNMYPSIRTTSSIAAWNQLERIFDLLDGLLRYPPVWAEYFYNALKEFHADGVQYVEVRSKLQRFYCLDGSKLPVQETVKIYQEQIGRFQTDNPDFIDAKIIYSPLRHATIDQMAKKSFPIW